MLAWTFSAITGLLFSTFSIATLIGCGAVAVAILTPPLIARFIPNLRVTAIYVAIGAFSYSFVAGKFYNAGLSQKQIEWDASLANEARDGETARSDAERTVRAEPPDVVRRDPRNRDNWKQ